MPIVTIDWCFKSTPEQRKSIIKEMSDCLIDDCDARRKIVTVIFREHSPEYFGLAGSLASETEDFESTVIVTLDWCARDNDCKDKIIEHAMHAICACGFEDDLVTVLFHDYPLNAVAQGGIMKLYEKH